MIWDVETTASTLPDTGSQLNSEKTPLGMRPSLLKTQRHSTGQPPSPIQQYATSETVTSVTYVPTTPSLVLAGVAMKWLRMYDLRSSTSVASVPNRAVWGFCPDPFDDFKIASYGDDGGFRIWDRRRLSEPVLAFSGADAGGDGGGTGNITMIGFCPTRRGLLGTLDRDSNSVRLWDILEGKRAGSHNVPQPANDPSVRPPVQPGSLAGMLAGNTPGAAPPAREDSGASAVFPPPILAHTRKG